MIKAKKRSRKYIEIAWTIRPLSGLMLEDGRFMLDLSPWDAERRRGKLGQIYLLRHEPEERRWTKWTRSNLIFVISKSGHLELTASNVVTLYNLLWSARRMFRSSLFQTPSGKIKLAGKHKEKTTWLNYKRWCGRVTRCNKQIFTSKGRTWNHPNFASHEFGAKAGRASIVVVDKITSVW